VGTAIADLLNLISALPQLSARFGFGSVEIKNYFFKRSRIQKYSDADPDVAPNGSESGSG
jgi:hypothetical protein